ncbi:MAG TPA: type II secretion system protein [Candidatus Saccharimonadia bacterium]|nr:type II secretion system protein [Candidatus Saccharimonadia bacterium]
MKTRIQQGFTLIELLVVITIIALLASLALPAFSKFQEKGNYTKGISNARQIVMVLKLYASDHGGSYPDNDKEAEPSDANSAFRVLFTEEAIDNELIFGCPISPYIPDGNIGSDAEKTKALEAGENHWMMTKGLSDSASGSIPLVYENALTGTWDPEWDNAKKGTNARGRSWSSGVIVGMNDGGAVMQPLESKKGKSKLKELGEGKNIFTQHNAEDSEETFEVLDILDK